MDRADSIAASRRGYSGVSKARGKRRCLKKKKNCVRKKELGATWGSGVVFAAVSQEGVAGHIFDET
jgi:hypothetical protein